MPMLDLLTQTAGAWAVPLGKAAAVFLGVWLAGRAATWALVRTAGRAGRRRSLVAMLERAARATVVVVAAVTALGTIGVDVTAFVAGLGLTGFALGFAFKDMISSFLAGLLILFYRPFDIGDTIAVVSLEGRVADIDLRYTWLDAGDRRFLVPNSTILTNPVTVLTAAPAPAATDG